MNTINQRLIFLLNEIFKGNVSEFARVTGVPQPTLNNIVGNRMSKPSVDNLERIINSIKALNANWLITGQGEMYNSDIKSTSSVKIMEGEKEKGSIPYYKDLPVSAGNNGLSAIQQSEVPSGYMSIPNVSAERLFPVVGCSMLPKIKPGDIIGVNSVNKWDRVEPDKIYMIITLEDRMIKRLRIDINDNEILWCISENENFKEFPINKSEIKYIYHVVYHGEIL